MDVEMFERLFNTIIDAHINFITLMFLQIFFKKKNQR